jgi:hypothetical protein
MTTDETEIVCLVRDLLFYSKIRAAAQSAGAILKSVRDPAKLKGQTGRLLLVDLNQPHALQAAADWRAQSGRAVVGFVSHVDSDTIFAARDLKIDQVLARSQFEKNLPTILMPKPDSQSR